MFGMTAESVLLSVWSVLSCFLILGRIEAQMLRARYLEALPAKEQVFCSALCQYFKVHFHQTANRITLLTQNKYQSDFSETLK